MDGLLSTYRNGLPNYREFAMTQLFMRSFEKER